MYILGHIWEVFFDVAKRRWLMCVCMFVICYDRTCEQCKSGTGYYYEIVRLRMFEEMCMSFQNVQLMKVSSAGS